MAVTTADVLEPIGDLALELFPGRDPSVVETMLAAYVADGAARVATLVLSEAEKDRAVIAWVYARAYRNVVARLSRTPASFTLTGEGSTTITGEQIRTFKELAERWERDYDAVTASPPTPEETPTAAAVNRYIF